MTRLVFRNITIAQCSARPIGRFTREARASRLYGSLGILIQYIDCASDPATPYREQPNWPPNGLLEKATHVLGHQIVGEGTVGILSWGRSLQCLPPCRVVPHQPREFPSRAPPNQSCHANREVCVVVTGVLAISGPGKREEERPRASGSCGAFRRAPRRHRNRPRGDGGRIPWRPGAPQGRGRSGPIRPRNVLAR
jgi:hypothetical protein